MAKAFKPSVVTANDLLDGHVIYLVGQEAWTSNIADAAVAYSREDAEQWLAGAQNQQHRIVGPDLAVVSVDDDGRPAPAHFREVFRANGPSLDPAIWRPQEHG